MITTTWRCPDCKETLYVTNSARYWCGECGAEKPVERVDPMGRDFVRAEIAIEYAVEKLVNLRAEL
jgi:hypothetical protein